MFRTFLSASLILVVSAFMGTAAQDTKDKDTKKQQATITKVDAKSGTITVQMKNKEGKEVDKTFKLTGDIRYFDSTGKAVAIDIFKSGDEVLVVEAEGRLTEMHRHHATQAENADRAFLHAAADINLAEMKLGKLAAGQASAPAVKKYGERLVTDHTKMNHELHDLAKSQNMLFPEKLGKKHQELYDQLSKQKGADFDHAFTKAMISGHEKAITKFESEAKNGQDTQLKSFAQTWLPTLREHLQLARNAEKEIK